MLNAKKITYDELLERLCDQENVETIDLGTVSLHIVQKTGEGRMTVLVENPGSYEQSAELTL